MNTILSPARLGQVGLRNRVVMALMTRARANADETPGLLASKYYAQRAALGLIVIDGLQPSGDGQDYAIGCTDYPTMKDSAV